MQYGILSMHTVFLLYFDLHTAKHIISENLHFEMSQLRYLN